MECDLGRTRLDERWSLGLFCCRCLDEKRRIHRAFVFLGWGFSVAWANDPGRFDVSEGPLWILGASLNNPYINKTWAPPSSTPIPHSPHF